jgi:hypothetical protein
MDGITITRTVNGYQVVGEVHAEHVWRVAGDQGSKVAYQTGGTHAVTGAPRWAELVKGGNPPEGADLYEII